MKQYQFNKLIRSKLPERMKREGVRIFGRHLTDDEFAVELKNKLIEEALEVKDTNNHSDLLKELADVMEVIEALMSINNITKEEIEMERITKREINGNFLASNFVDYIEVSVENNKVIEYLENKNRPYQFKATV